MAKDVQILKNEAKGLEDAFFAKKNELLLRELQQKAKIEEKRKAISAVVKSKDPEIIDHLLELGVRPEFLSWLLDSFPWPLLRGQMDIWTIGSEKPSWRLLPSGVLNRAAPTTPCWRSHAIGYVMLVYFVQLHLCVILGFMKDEQLRKHLPRMFSLIKNESWGLEDDRIPS